MMRRLSALAIVMAAASCSVVTAPTPAPTMTQLRVLVVQFADQATPIAKAVVTRSWGGVGDNRLTDAAGVAIVFVPIGTDATITVTARGYRGFSVTARVGSPETWTFYLEAAGPN